MRLIAPPLPPAFAALEHHHQARAERPVAELAPEVQAQLEQTPLRLGQSLLVLGPAQRGREVELGQSLRRHKSQHALGVGGRHRRTVPRASNQQAIGCRAPA